MKKEFVKQNKTEELEGVKVAPATEAPQVKETSNGFMKYGDVTEAKANIFKNFTLKPTGDFMKTPEKEPCVVLPFNCVKMMSLRYGMKRVKTQLIAEMSGADRFLFEDLKITKDKKLVLVVNKAHVLKPENTGLMGAMMNDPLFRISMDKIPSALGNICEGELRLQAYGDDLVVVLDSTKVASLIFKTSCVGETDIANYVKIGVPVIQHDAMYFALLIENAQLSDNKFMAMRDEIVCARLQLTHDQLQAKAYEYLNKQNCTQIKDMLIFVRTADLACQPSGYEALSSQLAGGADLQTIPLLRIIGDQFLSPMDGRVSSNGLLSMLIQKANKVDTINEKEVRKIYGDILDNKIYSYNVGITEELTILPNFKKLVMMSLFGQFINYRMDIASDERVIAINISL